MRQILSEILVKKPVLINDGAASTHLECLGCNLNDKLWTAKVLKEQPELIKQLHLDYFDAGANFGVSVSYQASIQGFTDLGSTKDEAEIFIESSALLLLEARDEWWKKNASSQAIYPITAGSIGPYGAYLADGSEYRGDYSIVKNELRAFHKRRLEILWNAGLDILAIETIPSLDEAIILAEIVEELDAKCWISFSAKNATQISDGTNISTCVNALEKFHCVEAIGINCTAPKYIESLIKSIRSQTKKPIIAYGNLGNIYDANTKTWSKEQEDKSYTDYAIEWKKAGANIIGGCCGILPKDISAIAAKVLDSDR